MRMLEESLRALQTDYVDVYLNHAVNDVARLKSEEWQSFVERAKRAGKIRAAGMSGHSGRLGECLTYALDHELVDVILVAYNFSQQPSFRDQVKRYLKGLASSFDLITTHPELPQILKRAHAAGVGVMVMKTLKGARKNDMRLYEGPGRTFAQSAFRFVLSDPSVDGLVVSMTDTDMIDEYVEASGSGEPDAEDLALLARYESINAGSTCQVGCGECLDACPASVPIADAMRIRMYAQDYGVPRIAEREYAALPIDASPCLECSGAPCAQACPNGLAIPDLNRDTHRRLS
jgi:predicted aldo/keto reductase-like oxidoreductase